jgi:hypothetical protein
MKTRNPLLLVIICSLCAFCAFGAETPAAKATAPTTAELAKTENLAADLAAKTAEVAKLNNELAELRTVAEVFMLQRDGGDKIAQSMQIQLRLAQATNQKLTRDLEQAKAKLTAIDKKESTAATVASATPPESANKKTPPEKKAGG